MQHRNERSWSTLARALGASGLIAAVGLMPPSASPGPVAAAEVPADHIVLRVNSIKVIDDSDWGEGEMEYTARIQRISPSCGGLCANEKFEFVYRFGADSGETRSFVGRPEALVPQYRPQPDDPNVYVQPQAGLALFHGDSLRVEFKGNESDPFADDYVGKFIEDFTEAQQWGKGAAHVTASRDTLGFGGFEVNYEIVKASLPDLIVSEIRVGNFADNGDDIVCVEVQNIGAEPAGRYTVRFYVDGAIPRNGEMVEAIHLPNVTFPGTGVRERCFQTTIAGGQHTFAAAVDEDQVLPELDENNNSKGLVATIFRAPLGGVLNPLGPNVVMDPGVLDPGPGTNPTPTPTPQPAQADLVPSMLKVEGEEPDGNEDCDSGRNDITVVVKNQGMADAAAFKVALLVDDDEDDGDEEDVETLLKGSEITVRFNNIRLEKGRNDLKIRVDTEQKIAESSESNNELMREARCKDDD
jgi:hypothetical protein